MTTKDGGKSCRSRSDCEIECLYVGPQAEAANAKLGQCSADNDLFGCKSYFHNGKVTGLCMD